MTSIFIAATLMAFAALVGMIYAASHHGAALSRISSLANHAESLRDREAMHQIEMQATLDLTVRQAELLRKKAAEIDDLNEDLAQLLKLIPAYGRDPKTGRFKKVRTQ